MRRTVLDLMANAAQLLNRSSPQYPDFRILRNLSRTDPGQTTRSDLIRHDFDMTPETGDRSLLRMLDMLDRILITEEDLNWVFVI